MSETHDSFILARFEAMTSAWVNRFSIAAIPPLRRSTAQLQSFQHNRDIFVLTMLMISFAAMVLFPSGADWRSRYACQAITAFAAYRTIDVFITLARTGVFLNFRGDVSVRDEPLWRKQRILIGVMLNYIEINMWFSVIYRQISLTSSCQFENRITAMDQAFNLSFSTMTTIGYGRYTPDGIVSNVFAYFQVLIGVVLLVLVVGSVLALLTGDTAGKTGPAAGVQTQTTVASRGKSLNDWFRPILSLAVSCAFLFWFFGLAFCAPSNGTHEEITPPSAGTLRLPPGGFPTAPRP